ncbi:MAG: BTAD domain-containing putative transcriptional regulator [Paracoccaceae bacterium]
MKLTLLGGISAKDSSGDPLPFPTRKSEALLALLVLSPGLSLTRERAAELLWGDRGEIQARASLRQELSNLRKLCAQADCDVLEADRQTLRLREGALDVDALEFRARAEAGDSEGAAALYSGPLLDGFDAKSAAFDDWMRLERQNLHALAVRVLSGVTEAKLASGDALAARASGERLVALDPLSEAAYRLLIRALDACGDRSAALAAYDAMAVELRDSLDVDPSPETAVLRAQLLDAGAPEGSTAPTRQARPAVTPRFFKGRPAVGVIPFRCLNSDEDSQFLASGMTEDVVSGLASWRWFPVIGTATMQKYREEPASLPEIGADTGARYVLSGTLRRSGNALRANVELGDTETGAQIWSQRFDRRMSDMFALQDEISEQIVHRIEPEISRAESRRILRKRPEDLSAWEMVQKARAIKYRSGLAYGTREDTEIAFGLLRSAIELDPLSSIAHVDLARCHWHSIICAWTDDPVRARDRAIARAERAIELDDGSWEAFGTIGLIQIFGLHEIDAGIESQRRALELNPSAALAHFYVACGLEFSGDLDKALEHLEIGRQLDPRSRGAPIFYSDFSSCHLLRGDLDEAVEYGRKSVAADRNYVRGRQRLVAALSERGDLDAAEEQLAILRGQQPDINLDYLRRTYPFRRAEHLAVFVRAFARLGVT